MRVVTVAISVCAVVTIALAAFSFWRIVWVGEYWLCVSCGRVFVEARPHGIGIIAGGFQGDPPLWDRLRGALILPESGFSASGGRWFLIPLWLPASIFTLVALICWWRLSRRDAGTNCRSCGYNLAGNVSGTCPECGAAVPEDLVQRDDSAERDARVGQRNEQAEPES